MSESPGLDAGTAPASVTQWTRIGGVLVERDDLIEAIGALRAARFRHDHHKVAEGSRQPAREHISTACSLTSTCAIIPRTASWRRPA
jgi:hypothetical protein